MSKRRPQHRILALSLIGVVAGVAFVTSLTSSRVGAQSKAVSYPRNQTLITIGAQWGPIAGTNPYVGNYATGMVGLVNETLLRYDPLKDRYINWLAKSARFSGKKVYTVKIRSGIKWSNGQKFTGKDVAWNFRLGRFSSAYWHDLYSTLKSIKVKGLTVKFNFKGTPQYIQWQHLIWNLPLINPGQGKSINNKTLTTYSPKNPIGTGPYALDPAGYDAAVRVVWKKKAVWWAAKQELAPSPAPKYVIDLANRANTCALMLPGCGYGEDLNNNYLPGVQNLVASGDMQMYYPSKPYHLSANTAWLELNTTKPALNDKRFRKALATSINIGNVVKNGYGDLVLPANATGLLPTWKKWVDRKQLKSLGFKYSTDRTKSMLSAAGYADKDSDGCVETPGGKKIDLKIAVPQGWSDWEIARDMIIASAKKARICMHKDEGDYNHWQSERNQGLFDTVIDNDFHLSDSPWTYYDGIFHLPIDLEQTTANFSRYANVEAWSLVKKLDRTQSEDVTRRKALMKQLQKITLTDLPIIPLWYNGVWAQWRSRYWTNWPSSTSKRNYVPCTWRGYMQMTGIDMITHLKAA